MKTVPVCVAAALLACASVRASAQTNAGPSSTTLSMLAKAFAGGDSQSIDRFWAKAAERHSPLLETIPGDPRHILATFVWRGDSTVKDVVLVAHPDGVAPFLDPRSHLTRLGATNVWYRTHRLPADAEFSYAFAVNAKAAGNVGGSLKPDPLNPLQYRILTGPLRSIARMPDVGPNPWIQDRHARAGVLRENIVPSPTLATGGTRRVSVYVPPGVLPKQPNLLILLDGATYLDAMPTTRILDNLLADRRIAPTIVAFVADADAEGWRTDLYFSDAFVDFMATGLIPWLEHAYGFTATPGRTGIGGESIAGLTAAFAAFRRPDLFSKVLTQSASFWLNNHDEDGGEPEWLSRQFLKGGPSRFTFWIDVGTMEFVANEADRSFQPFVPGTTSLLAANRHLRDVLRGRCVDVRYNESDGDHEPLRWARTLPAGLMALFGTEERPPPTSAPHGAGC